MLAHVLHDIIAGEEFLTYTAAHHQGATEMSRAVMSSIFMSVSDVRITRFKGVIETILEFIVYYFFFDGQIWS